jgi:transcriptional repressor NrdR
MRTAVPNPSLAPSMKVSYTFIFALIPAMMNRIITEIEVDLRNSFQAEVHTSEIGRRVLEKLRDVDEVSYIRYASVYRNFDDIESFMQELNAMKKE